MLSPAPSPEPVSRPNPVDRLPRKHPVAASSLLAAAVAAFAHCLGSALAGSQPFGPMNRNVNDLGTQFVPFHAHLWDVLHGRADGGWLINWQSGYGSSFLPDVGTYLSSPFTPLVALFPREQIDLAVYVVTVLRIGTAAAVMAWLLLTLRPASRGRGGGGGVGEGGSDGRWWLAGTLGAAYALCGWAVIEASYNPMWLDGLIAFPLLCLVGEWVRTGRRFRVWFGAGVPLVALVWTANFYTAYMATVGAGLVLGVRLLTERPGGGAGEGDARRKGEGVRSLRTVVRSLRTVARACAVVALGIGLSAPVLLTVFAGTRHAYPGMGLTFRPAEWTDVLARLLPATYSFSSPAMYVTAAVLVPAFALPFHRGVAVRVRVGWCALVVAVLVSMQWGPTHLAWHAFAEPNGSPYRQTFVLSGVLVIAAWLTVGSGRLDRRALAAGAGGVAVLATAGLGSAFAGRWAWLGASVGLLAVVGALALLGRAWREGYEEGAAGDGPEYREGTAGVAPEHGVREARRRRGFAVAGAVLLVGCTVGQSALTTAWAAKRRVAAQDDHAPYGARQGAQRAVIAGVDGWPEHRTDPGRAQTVHNDAMVVGGQGASYYSSMTSEVLTRTLTALGDGWNGSGRAPHSLDNPVTDALFGVSARLRSTYRKGADTTFTVLRRDAAPLVTIRTLPPGKARYGHSAFSNQELLLGAKVYERLPVVSAGAAGGAAGVRATTGTCTPGTPVYLWAPGLKGNARTAGGTEEPVGFDAKRGRVRAAVQQVGVTPADGRVRVELRGSGAAGAEAACLREDRLATAVRSLRAAGAASVEVDDGTVRAEVRGSAAAGRTAVLAVPRIAGWRCATDDEELRPADSHLGLIAVPLTNTTHELHCEFRPPGLRAGSALGLGSAALALTLTTAHVLRRRGEGHGEARGEEAGPAATRPLPEPNARIAAQR